MLALILVTKGILRFHAKRRADAALRGRERRPAEA